MLITFYLLYLNKYPEPEARLAFSRSPPNSLTMASKTMGAGYCGQCNNHSMNNFFPIFFDKKLQTQIASTEQLHLTLLCNNTT